jgi:hypothetical protein
MTRILRHDERGGALVEAPFAICILLLLAMGLTTIVQLAWTHLALSSAVGASTRYATHVEYDPAIGGIDRHRTETQVRTWAEEVAAEAGVEPDCGCVTIVGRHVPSGVEAPLEELVAGDEIVITVATVVSNPLYRAAASITNAASHVVGGGDVFDPDGIGVKAGASTYVE